MRLDRRMLPSLWPLLSGRARTAVQLLQRHLPPGRPAVVALVGTLGALHVAQQCVHLVQREAAVRAHRAVAGHGGQQVVARALKTRLASTCASSASTQRASSTASASAQRGRDGAHGQRAGADSGARSRPS